MNEYDMRQLRLMEQNIDNFLKGKIGLLEIINNLDSLLSKLENIDLEWCQIFQSWWWDLEQVYAFMASEKRSNYNRDEINFIEEAIQHLKKMLLYKFQTYGNKSYKCPCCGFFTLAEPPPGTHEICNVCNWEDDYVQFNDPKLREGTNHRSLLEAQEQFKATGRTCVNQVEKPY